MKTHVKILTALTAPVIAAGLALAAAIPAQATGHRIQIREIYYNSPGSDTGSVSSLDHEWVELHNTSGSSIRLTGWTLSDAQGHTFTFPAYTIRPYGNVKVRTGPGTNTQYSLYWGRGWYVWNNTGDTATVRNRAAALIDQCSYTGTSLGYVNC
jgi:hypothetical protein